MKRRTKLLVVFSLVFSLLLVACGTGASTEAETPSADSVSDEYVTGTYTGKSSGYGGEMEVSVTLSEDGIQEIEIVNDYETYGVGKVALEEIKSRIIEGQSTDVEALTGATASSKGLMMAVRGALDEAGIPKDQFADQYIEVREYPSEMTADVVIVGGGGAGLAAAVTAMQEDASVIVLEKNGFVGGNTIVCGGIYNTPDPERQPAQGIEDSPELFYKQTYEGGDSHGNPELVKVLTYNAYDDYKWLEDLGMVFEDTIIQGAGSLYPRTHQSIDPLGTGFINAYMGALAEGENVSVLTETTADELLIEDDRVVGVKATNYDGSPLVLNASKGVIIATGGFSKNTDMVLEYNTSGKWPNLTADTVSTNIDSIRGDGITMSKEAGADLVDMEQMQFLYLGIPNQGEISGLVDLGAENTIFVNTNGERFVREDGRRDVICSAIFEQDQGKMYLMHSADTIDVETEKTLEGVPLKEIIEEGKYGWQIGDTLEELAENLGVPADNLVKTVEEYNNAVDTQVDEFGRELLTKKMETGPFIAVPRVPSLHHTMGGLRIDTNARVLDSEGTPIKGLYAGGEVTGGIHGKNRLGGNAVVDTVVFGRIAGESAANEL